MTEEENRRFEVGELVEDPQNEEEQEAVVILNAEGTLEDWDIGTNEDGEDITVADHPSNEDYDPEGKVAVVAWREHIDNKLKWKNISKERLFDTCCSAGVPFYGFPEERLQPTGEKE